MSNAVKDQSGRKKIVHHLDTPFASSPWPFISAEDQEIILEMLCLALAPIVKHRSKYWKKSKGKRTSRYIVRTNKAAEEQAARPAIWNQVDVGFNAINQKLQGLDPDTKSSLPGEKPQLPYSMVFVSRGDQSSSFNSHYPRLVAAATRRCQSDRDIRLVGFSASASRKIAARLSLPRVSAIAFHTNTLEFYSLWDLVKRKVSPVSIPWLGEVKELEYRPTNIKHVETSVGAKKTKATSDTKQ